MKISPEKYDSGVDALRVCPEAKDCKRNATNVQKTNQSKKAAKYRSAFMAGYKSWKCLQSISAMWKIYPKCSFNSNHSPICHFVSLPLKNV